MSESLPDGVADLIAAVAADREHGASWLARAALQVMARCAERSPATSVDAFARDLRACARALIASRPGMAPVRFWIDRLLDEVQAAMAHQPDPSAMRAIVVEQVARLVEESERASRRAAEVAVDRLPAASVIATASYSQTLLAAFQLAWQAGKLRGILAAESRSVTGHRYGADLAAALQSTSIPIEVIPDDQIPARVAEAQRVWLGADSILVDGSVINGTPSAAVAEAAHRLGRPVEVIGEVAKVDCWSQPETIAIPEDFDRIPAEWIRAVVTERGTLNPRQVGEQFCAERAADERAVARAIDDVSPLLINADSREEPAALVERIAEQLVARQETLAVAESSAGGRICDLLTDRAGSSAWFLGGLIAYSNPSKQQVAGLTAEELARFGAVSGGTARALAAGARRLFGASWGIGETGIAGPRGGRRSRKPAGLSYVAIAGPGDLQLVRVVNTGREERTANKHAFAVAALALLVEQLEKQP